MRLIDADELLEHVGRDKLDSRELIMQMIINAPTVHVEDPILVSIKERLSDIENDLSFRTQQRPTRAFPLNADPVYGCPWCETVVEKGTKYCPECGQAILWYPNE